jgi:hypothetical protein
MSQAGSLSCIGLGLSQKATGNLPMAYRIDSNA